MTDGETPTVVDPLPQTPDDSGAGAPGGTTWISDQIVAKIAGIAAREVDGVAGMRSEDGKRGWGMQRPKETELAGVTVTDDEATIDLRLVVLDGVVIPTVVEAVRARVVSRVQESTGMRVARVDIGVVDVVTTDEMAADADQGSGEE
ncbi:MAG: Asp23/Gls24 family envelope stress response protein [Miltoncostaeaceae bacterium]